MLFAVVICFHFTIFVVLETTVEAAQSKVDALWFAFILLSLSYWKQLTAGGAQRSRRCDLLSFYYLCRTGNNWGHSAPRRRCVVICFHFTIFVVLETTDIQYQWNGWELWFAFILLSLSYWKQPEDISTPSQRCCDLLSFYYLCRTGNNSPFNILVFCVVVICFHFTIFVVLETTSWKTTPLNLRCDLLSFYYLCRTGNNMF